MEAKQSSEKTRDVFLIVAMLSQAVAFFTASSSGAQLGINLLIWFIVLNVILKLTWKIARSERSSVRAAYLIGIGCMPFAFLALTIWISPWFDWVTLFSK